MTKGKHKKNNSNRRNGSNSPQSETDPCKKCRKEDQPTNMNIPGDAQPEISHSEVIRTIVDSPEESNRSSTQEYYTPPQEKAKNARDELVKSQLGNRYSASSALPFIVFIERAVQDPEPPQTHRKFIGNLHLLAISKRLCNQFKNLKITEIRRVGKSLISINFDTFQQANTFIASRASLTEGWTSYIPNFKLYRTGVIRNVDKSLSAQDIRDGITWPDAPINIINIERLKYIPRGSVEVLDSSSIKITFESHLPEAMYIWRNRHRVFPFVYSVKRCQNCSRIGHSARVCRSDSACARCSYGHPSATCHSAYLNA